MGTGAASYGDLRPKTAASAPDTSSASNGNLYMQMHRSSKGGARGSKASMSNEQQPAASTPPAPDGPESAAHDITAAQPYHTSQAAAVDASHSASAATAPVALPSFNKWQPAGQDSAVEERMAENMGQSLDMYGTAAAPYEMAHAEANGVHTAYEPSSTGEWTQTAEASYSQSDAYPSVHGEQPNGIAEPSGHAPDSVIPPGFDAVTGQIAGGNEPSHPPHNLPDTTTAHGYSAEDSSVFGWQHAAANGSSQGGEWPQQQSQQQGVYANGYTAEQQQYSEPYWQQQNAQDHYSSYYQQPGYQAADAGINVEGSPLASQEGHSTQHISAQQSWNATSHATAGAPLTSQHSAQPAAFGSWSDFNQHPAYSKDDFMHPSLPGISTAAHHSNDSNAFDTSSKSATVSRTSEAAAVSSPMALPRRTSTTVPQAESPSYTLALDTRPAYQRARSPLAAYSNPGMPVRSSSRGSMEASSPKGIAARSSYGSSGASPGATAFPSGDYSKLLSTPPNFFIPSIPQQQDHPGGEDMPSSSSSYPATSQSGTSLYMPQPPQASRSLSGSQANLYLPGAASSSQAVSRQPSTAAYMPMSQTGASSTPAQRYPSYAGLPGVIDQPVAEEGHTLYDSEQDSALQRDSMSHWQHPSTKTHAYDKFLNDRLKQVDWGKKHFRRPGKINKPLPWEVFDQEQQEKAAHRGQTPAGRPLCWFCIPSALFWPDACCKLCTPASSKLRLVYNHHNLKIHARCLNS